jgi:hypothetical protein
MTDASARATLLQEFKSDCPHQLTTHTKLHVLASLAEHFFGCAGVGLSFVQLSSVMFSGAHTHF